MNDTRRKMIEKVVKAIDAANGDIDPIIEAEQEAFDNLPESMQGGDQGEKLSNAIEALNEAKEALDNAISSLETATE